MESSHSRCVILAILGCDMVLFKQEFASQHKPQEINPDDLDDDEEDEDSKTKDDL